MIGIFDSGIGGVTVFKEILKELPNYKYIYYSDSANNPYGNKSQEEIIAISQKIITFLKNKGCQIIVIACNTASAMAVDDLRKEFKIPIIAIEPACKMVYDKSYLKKTLILATKGTCDSAKFKKLYQKYDNHQTIIYECHNLAKIIEEDKVLEVKKYLKTHLSQFKGVENVILGCTHYPLIKDEIKAVLGDIQFYDGAKGVAKQLKNTIMKENLPEEKKEIIFIDSAHSKVKEERFFSMLKSLSFD